MSLSAGMPGPPAKQPTRSAQGSEHRTEKAMTTQNVKGTTERVLSFKLDRLLPGPVPRVWDHVTKPELLSNWFGNGVIELRAGGKVHLMEGHIRGVVTQCRAPNLITYTWNVFNPGDPPEAVSAFPESYLTLQLEERAKDVLLRLTHLPILDRFEAQNAMGWHTFVDMAEAALRGEPAQPRSAYMPKNAKLYGVDLSNLAR
jgi:uncharacterized protein YndB with AHSA1/START domain